MALTKLNEETFANLNLILRAELQGALLHRETISDLISTQKCNYELLNILDKEFGMYADLVGDLINKSFEMLEHKSTCNKLLKEAEDEGYF